MDTNLPNGVTCSGPGGCAASCDNAKYTIGCVGGGCDMTCPQSVNICDQVCTGGRCDSTCDSEKCTLGCTGGGCTMTCPAGVKECHLICTGGGCHFKCDAEDCKLDCPGGGCTRGTSSSTKVGVSAVLFFVFTLVTFV